MIRTGDELVIDIQKNTLKNVTQQTSCELKPLGDVMGILKAGDVFAYAKQEGLID